MLLSESPISHLEIEKPSFWTLGSCPDGARRKSPMRVKHVYADTKAGKVWMSTLRGVLKRLKMERTVKALVVDNVLPSLCAYTI